MDVVKEVCKTCKTYTNHNIVHVIKDDAESQDGEFWIEKRWQIIKCAGCEDYSFRYTFLDSESYNHTEEDWDYLVHVYPPRSTTMRIQKDFYHVPNKIRNMYIETIKAFNNDMFVLCGAGLRATIESICNEMGIDKVEVKYKDKSGVEKTKKSKDLIDKISELSKRGSITVAHSDVLQTQRHIGNNALHTQTPPTERELTISIDIVEHTLENIYEMTQKANRLKRLF